MFDNFVHSSLLDRLRHLESNDMSVRLEFHLVTELERLQVDSERVDSRRKSECILPNRCLSGAVFHEDSKSEVRFARSRFVRALDQKQV